MKKFVNIIIFSVLIFGLFSCSKKNTEPAYVLTEEDMQIINSVKQVKWYEGEDKTKAFELLDKAIEAKPYVWEFYSFKISIANSLRKSLDDYKNGVHVILECMQKYSTHATYKFTPYQNYLYGFSLMCEGQKQEAEKYLNEGFKYLSSLPRKIKNGSTEEFESGNALMCGFVLGKVDSKLLEKLKKSYENEFLAENIDYLFEQITPEEYINNYGAMSLDFDDMDADLYFED